MDFCIDSRIDGMRLLDFLRREVGLTGAMLRHLKFTDDGITVNGSHVTVRHVLREGELLSLKTEDDGNDSDIKPCDIELSIAYEDGEIVLPNKPPFMPTHPSHGHYDDTVANALAFRYREKGIPFVFRPINRLDRNTSGLVLVARNRMSAGFLASAMKRGEIRKEYIAVLEGVPKQSEGVIETYMKRTDESIIVRRVCGENEGGDHALTRYRVILSDMEKGYSVVLASPVTGRTHQLRVHFAHMGCPIVGDDMYGSESEYIPRHALHAYTMSFPKPRTETGERLEVFTDPILPSDMGELIERLFSKKAREEIESLGAMKETVN